MITFLNPTAGPARGQTQMAPRLKTLDGATLGVIWNGRAYGDKVFDRVLEALRERHRIKDIVFRQKPYIGNLAPEPILAEIASRADGAITGVGD
jgi:hypothetical protein